MKRIFIFTFIILALLIGCQSTQNFAQQPMASPPTPIDTKSNNPAVQQYNSADKQYNRNIGKSESVNISPQEEKHVKALIAYFSYTGNTVKVAEHIRTLTGGDLFEIETVKPYPDDYDACLTRASEELAADYRPELSTHIDNMDNYDVIFIGYPIWLGNTPMSVRSFLEEYDMSGKMIIPFCTSGSSGISQSVSAIRKLCSNSDISDGLSINSSNINQAYELIEEWLDGLNIMTVKETGENAMQNINITIGNTVFQARLYNNDTTKAFLAQLPLTLKMSELNGNEKYYNMTNSLPMNSQQVGSVNAGDLMLYGSDCLVLFYESFATSYSYTKLGYIENVTGLANALGSGSVQVSISQ